MESSTAPEDVKSTYWQHLYREAEGFQSELAFYEGEIRFLRSLLSRHLHWLLEEDQFPKIQSALERLQTVEKDSRDLRNNNQSVINRLGFLLENPFTQNESAVLENFRQTKNELNALIVEYRDAKDTIYTMVEQVMRTEKARRMLSAPPETAIPSKS